MTTLALIASPGKIRALKIGLVRHLKEIIFLVRRQLRMLVVDDDNFGLPQTTKFR